MLGLVLFSCQDNRQQPSELLIKEMNLKRGEVISCGPADKKFGTVLFPVSSSNVVKEDFNLAVNLLHSFEYDEAEKVFAKIIDKEPSCAMAYWGIAMSNFHPLWTPPTEAELKKGEKALEIARQAGIKTKREEGYINAIEAFYLNWQQVDHKTRCINFEKAMEKLNAAFPDDKETAVFYALALTAAADPADKSFARQKKAGSILNGMYPGQPDHPGIVHYIIHTYDSPELAQLALPAARKYASVAPSSAHALHMPSHIFTRLGYWDECINSNRVSVESAQCYAQSAGIKGHWDEELHGLDYLVYAYLQRGENGEAKKQLDYLRTINTVTPFNFKVAYAFASIPSRYVFENRLWEEAAALESHKTDIPWENFPWQQAMLSYTRLMGAVHLGKKDAAQAELNNLNNLHQKLVVLKDAYKANQVDIQVKSSEGWIRLMENKEDEALTLMTLAADMEDKTEKHPVTPCELVPARELLGDMYMKLNQPGKALVEYKLSLKKHPNRFNGLYGAGLAAEKSGNIEEASTYYRQLLSFANSSSGKRPEMEYINQFLKRNKT